MIALRVKADRSSLNLNSEKQRERDKGISKLGNLRSRIKLKHIWENLGHLAELALSVHLEPQPHIFRTNLVRLTKF